MQVLIVAAQHGQAKLMHCMVTRQNAMWTAEDDLGRIALHWAAYNGHSDLVRYLVVLGADVYHTDHLGCTALHCAACRGEAECCDLLVKVRACHYCSRKRFYLR